MPSVRVWVVESDYDAAAVKHLANKLATHWGLDLSIQTAGKRAFNRVAMPRRGEDAFERAVELYLKQDDCVIFVVDYDSPSVVEEKRRQPKSLISRIEKVVAGKFAERVYLAWAVHELEAWLLVDCVGLCCYFSGSENHSSSRQKQAKKFQSLLRSVPGNTELIVEAESGGKGAKEYLIEFSEKILRVLNPKISPQTLNRKKYTESQSPAVAEYVEISSETLKRNESLQRFGELLAKYGAVG